MNFSELTVRLLLLFFPGIVCHAVVEALTVHKERKPHEVFLRAFVLGVLSYVTYAAVAALFSVRIDATGLRLPFPDVAFFRLLAANGTNGDAADIPPVSFGEIFLVTLVAFGLGLLLSAAIEKHWLHRFANWLRITKKFGPSDVWMFAFNSPEVTWATVRDRACNMMYQGFIRAWSDTHETREILLTDVKVYDETSGKFLYDADRMYLSRDRNNLTVELPNPPTEAK